MRAVPNWAVATAAAAPRCWWPAGRSRRPDSPSVTTRSGTPSASWPGRTPPTPGSWSVALVLLGCCYLSVAAVLHAAGLPSRFLLADRWGGHHRAGRRSPAPRSAARSATASRRRWPSSPWCSGRPDRHCGCRAGTHRHPTPEPPWAFRRAVGLSATLVLLALFGWCAFEVTSGSRTGLAERVTAVAVSLWPLLAVLSARRAHLAWVDRRCDSRRPDLPTSGVVPPDPLGPTIGPAPRGPDRLP